MQARAPYKIPAPVADAIEKIQKPDTRKAGIEVFRKLFGDSSKALATKLAYMAVLLESKEGEKVAKQMLSLLPKPHECYSQIPPLVGPPFSLPGETIGKLIDFFKPSIKHLQMLYPALASASNDLGAPACEIFFIKRRLALGTSTSLLEQYISHINLGFAQVSLNTLLGRERDGYDYKTEKNEVFSHFRTARKLEAKALKGSADALELNLIRQLINSYQDAEKAKSSIGEFYLQAAWEFEPENPLVVQAVSGFVDIVVQQAKTHVDHSRLVAALELVSSSSNAKLKEKTKAIQDLLQESSEDKMDDTAKASSYYLLNQFDKAIQYATAAVAKNPRDALALITMGLSYEKLPNPEQACHCYLLLIEQENVPADKLELAYVQLTANYVDLSRPHEVIQYGEKALTLNPAQVTARVNMAKAYMLMEETDKAKRVLDEARPASADDRALVEEHRQILFAKRVSLESKDGESNNMTLARAKMLIRRKKMAEAKQLGLQMLERDVNKTPARQVLAFVYRLEKDYPKALEYLLADAKVPSLRLTISFQLIECFYALDRDAEAEAEAQYYLVHSDYKTPTQVNFRLQVYGYLEAIYSAHNRVDEAIDFFLKSLQREGLSAAEQLRLNYYLAKLSFIQNKTVETETYAKRAIQLAPLAAPAEVYALLGFACYYATPQKFKEAIESLQQANAASPDRPDVVLHLGLAYHFLGNEHEQALKWLSRALDLNPFYAFQLQIDLPLAMMQELLQEKDKRDSSPERSSEKDSVSMEKKDEAPPQTLKPEQTPQILKPAEVASEPPREAKVTRPSVTRQHMVHEWHQARKRHQMREIERQHQEEQFEEKKAEAEGGWRLSDTLFVKRSAKGVHKLAFRNRDPERSRWYGMIDEAALASQCDADFLGECLALLSKGELTVQNGVGVRLLDADERAKTKSELGKDYYAKLRFFSEHRGARVYGEKFVSENGEDTLFCFNKVQWKHL